MGNRYTDVFRATGIDDEVLRHGVKLDYFSNITNAGTANEALDLVMNPAAMALLGKAHTEEQLAQLRRSVFRACIAYGVSLPSRAIIQARMLGVVVPT